MLLQAFIQSNWDKMMKRALDIIEPKQQMNIIISGAPNGAKNRFCILYSCSLSLTCSVMMKLVTRRLSMMRIQAHTGRNAATRPMETARYLRETL